MRQQPQSEASPRASLPATVTSVLLGAAGGIAVNSLGEDFGYPGAAAALGMAAIVSAVFWLRRLPSHAPLPRYTTGTLLTMAFIVTVAAAARPSWAMYAIVAAAAMVIVAIAIVTDLLTVFRAVAGVTVVAIGIMLAGTGIAVIVRSHPLDGAILTVQGALVVLIGAYLSVAFQPTRQAAFGLGVICLVSGVMALAVGFTAPSGADGGRGQAVVAVLGLAFLSSGVALLARQPFVRGVAAIVAGVSLIVTAVIGLIASGMADFSVREALLIVALLAAGIGAIGAGVVVMLPARHRWQARWARLTGRTGRNTNGMF